MDPRVRYWKTLAEYDADTAAAMLRTGRYVYVGFMCHQSVEKMLKAAWQAAHVDLPFTQGRPPSKADEAVLHEAHREDCEAHRMDRRTALARARTFARLARRIVRTGDAYLFGSYAAGRPRPDSDVDVAIVVPSLRGDYLRTLSRLYRLRGEVDVRIEPHLVVEDSDPQGFSQEVVRTGIRL
jgi:predicted nucleotidyltransferase